MRFRQNSSNEVFIRITLKTDVDNNFFDKSYSNTMQFDKPTPWASRHINTFGKFNFAITSLKSRAQFFRGYFARRSTLNINIMRLRHIGHIFVFAFFCTRKFTIYITNLVIGDMRVDKLIWGELNHWRRFGLWLKVLIYAQLSCVGIAWTYYHIVIAPINVFGKGDAYPKVGQASQLVINELAIVVPVQYKVTRFWIDITRS